MLTNDKRGVYGVRLRNERVRLGYTQARWAERCGVSKTSQVNYEAGTYLPDVEYLSGTVKLGADPFYLLSGRTTETSTVTRLDWDLVAKITVYMGAWERTSAGALPEPVRAELLKLLYTQYSVNGGVDEDDLRKSLDLLGVAGSEHDRRAAETVADRVGVRESV